MLTTTYPFFLQVNLIMDTFAALALATDPPTPDLLNRTPESRTAPLITFAMWKMILGQAVFQLVISTVLLYSDLLELDETHYQAEELQTVVFNTFVFLQLFNEIKYASLVLLYPLYIYLLSRIELQLGKPDHNMRHFDFFYSPAAVSSTINLMSLRAFSKTNFSSSSSSPRSSFK